MIMLCCSNSSIVLWRVPRGALSKTWGAWAPQDPPQLRHWLLNYYQVDY